MSSRVDRVFRQCPVCSLVRVMDDDDWLVACDACRQPGFPAVASDATRTEGKP